MLHTSNYPRSLTGLGALLAAVMLMITSCGGSGSATADRDAPSSTSSPFTVGSVPKGYELAVAGTGNQQQLWGSDSSGTQEPFTVLSPDGKATGPGVVIVSVTGFEGYEGKLYQTQYGYGDDLPTSVHLTVDGHDALYVPASPKSRFPGASLVVDRGNDLAVRVTSAHGTAAELEAIERHIVPGKSHLEAPSVPNPPKGLQVIGHVDADAIIGTFPVFRVDNADITGTSRTHTITWADGGSTLTVMTLPGASLDLAAFEALPNTANGDSGSTEHVTVDGRDGVLYSGPDRSGTALANPSAKVKLVPRALVTTTSWGDALLVNPGASSTSLSAEALVNVAASVGKASPKQWKQLLVASFGGPGLNPDKGRTVVARGKQGNISWLLQTSAGGSSPVDPCLKLSTLVRACAGGAGSFSGGNSTESSTLSASAPSGSPELHGLPPFVIATTAESGTAVRMTSEPGRPTGELHPIPGTSLRAGVVFLSTKPTKSALYVCKEPKIPVPESITLGRIDVLDAAGKAVGCIGFDVG